MKILALDQAQNVTGYSVFDGTDLIKWGVLNYFKEDVEYRLPLMCNHIQLIIKKYRPQLIIFEGVSLKDSVQRLIHLAQVQGCIIQMCIEDKIPYKIYQPTLWRRILNFEQNNNTTRNELKQQAINLVYECYGIKVKHDCAEAICIALAHLKRTGLLPDLDETGIRYENTRIRSVNEC